MRVMLEPHTENSYVNTVNHTPPHIEHLALLEFSSSYFMTYFCAPISSIVSRV